MLFTPIYVAAHALPSYVQVALKQADETSQLKGEPTSSETAVPGETSLFDGTGLLVWPGSRLLASFLAHPLGMRHCYPQLTEGWTVEGMPKFATSGLEPGHCRCWVCTFEPKHFSVATITGKHSNHDQLCLVKILEYTWYRFCVCV